MKKIVIGIVASIVASLGLWVGLGNGLVAQARPTSARAHTAMVRTTRSEALHARAATRVVHRSSGSGDPSGTSEDPSGSEGESTTPESDGVDCQQDGNFDGVNAAGTGPGCDGSGT